MPTDDLMKELLYYDPLTVTQETHRHLPGIDAFRYFFSIFHSQTVPIDRTGTLRLPVRTTNLYPLPRMRTFTKTYKDICLERAQELLRISDTEQLPMKIFYSGGIDSTLVVVSLLRCATPAQRRNMTIMLSEDSIAENPRFFAEHIRGNMPTDSSALFHYELGEPCLIVNGEHNDQLFGSEAVGSLINVAGCEHIHKPYERELFFRFFNDKVNRPHVTNFYLDLFERLMQTAPITIRTNSEFLWWINFTLMWQTVSLRMFPYIAKRNVEKITPKYVSHNYQPFFRTEDFELWSMNNPDKKIRDGWHTYKYEAKNIIFDFTHDAEYRDTKLKKGSLHTLMMYQNAYNFIDDQWSFHRQLNVHEYYQHDNDFAVTLPSAVS